MKHLPLRQKLLWMTSALFLATVATMSITLWSTLNNKTDELFVEVDKALNDEIRTKLTASAGRYGEKVAAFINEAYRIPYSFSAMMENEALVGRMNRETVQDAVGAVLQKNRQISSMYAQFEPNGFDGRDSEFTASGLMHSVEGVGTLEVYFYRNDDGSQTQSQVDDANEKYADTRNEFGLREAEWYLCAKDTQKPCLMEPYLYEITPGNNMLMTSLTVPIVRSGAFRGVVGVDLNLPVFQKMIEELSASLYQGQAKVTLLSTKGLIVAASHYDRKARPLGEVMDKALANQILGLGKGDGYLLNDNSMIVAYPINIPLSGSQWLLTIEVPRHIAFASADQVEGSMEAMAASLGRFVLLLGIGVAAVAVILIALFIRSVVAPIQQIQQRVSQLASAEGDLTQSLKVDEHAELIALGNGFNAFIGKLHGLISELKKVATESRTESQATARIAEETKQSVNRQYSEIESVVTAVNEMSHTAHEVAKASEQTATESAAMASQVKLSQDSLTQAVSLVSTMSKESLQAKIAVGKVAESSTNISKILEVISAIAAQTNLLALNAAIEAARAGEQGRGFAVVADEVRSLASKTQASTDDISRLIDALEQEVKGASGIIDKGVGLAEQAVAQTEQAFEALSVMVARINEISNQVTQIATAAEEQSAVTEEVSRNITGISDSAAELMELAGKARESSESLAKLVGRQESQLAKLRT
ncbi:methyl-accepting chemotaxis protein [Shewanella sp. FJAT-52076]|uniref:methyl-accepting chemotaxis protein n=1 Tax=Shewanella sp. FJAT-52076 TaxID=2864202 RepID=UPI001C65A23E|nr:methyl-accepting chemotaxis protein [Shewanella sp. FJAT-52076]QYJ74424.1 methyl-accepting chemotaxis protein [Shewanella sp. FJAT-52076]